MVVEITEQINKPLEHTYKVFMDPENLDRWIIGFKSSELVSGNENEVGSVHKMSFEENGRTIVFMETVVEIEENKVYAFELDHSSMKSLIRVEFSGDESGTQLKSTMDVKAKGLLWKLLMPMMKTSMRKRQVEQYKRLKNVVESV